MFPVELFQSTLTKLVAVLNRFGIRFHLTGGITAVAYGEPRMTQDLDLVLDGDAALSKLLWAAKGSHKSRRDVRQILRHASHEESAMVRQMATSMGLLELLGAIPAVN